MIEVKNLTKRYGNHTAVDNISFTAEDGRVYGFLGPNGAGKSTTMNIMTGCLAATEGTVLINGHDIYEEPKAAKKCIGYLPELPPVYMDMTVEEYVSFVGEAKGVKGDALKKATDEVLADTGIINVRKRLIKTLSKGYRQRVGIAQAIIGDPDIIILDEPMVGLDPMQIIEIRELIRKLGKNHTVFLSSHILSEVSEVCDTLLIINGGKLVAVGSPEELSHISPDVHINLTAKGSREVVTQAISKVSGVKNCEVTAVSDGQVSVLVVADHDIRDDIFFALSDVRCPVVDISEDENKLENIFLQFMESEQQNENTSEAADDNQDDEDEEEYTPLFSQAPQENENEKGDDK